MFQKKTYFKPFKILNISIMKNRLFALLAFVLVGLIASAQKVEFEEYDLDNGLHVILHQDPSFI